MALERAGSDTPPRPPLTRGRKLLFAALLAVAVVGFAEAAASVVYFLRVPQERRQTLEVALGLTESEAYTAIRFRPHPYFNYTCNPDFVFPSGVKPHNSHGFRLPEWPTDKDPATVRIVAVGGSTTYGMHFERGEQVWPALLEEILGSRLERPVEVLNLGVPFYTPHEAIGVMAMLVPVLEPDVVLIHFGANNAFTVCYPDEGGPDNTRFRFSWTYRPVPPLTRAVMRRSFLARLVGYGLLARRGQLPGEMTRTMQYPLPDDSQAVANAATASGRYFRQTIRALVVLARTAGAVPVLLDHPLSPSWDQPTNRLYAQVVEAHRRNNRILAEVGQEQGVTVVGLYERMRDPRLFNDAIHSSADGMKLKAKLVADALEPVIASLP